MNRFPGFLTVACVLTLLGPGAELALAGEPDNNPATDTLPRGLPYEGHLAVDGVPLNGAVAVTFALWSLPVGGGMLFDETQQVSFVNGRFSVLLGVGMGDRRIPPIVFDAADVYLGVTVNNTQLSGRQRIVPVPHALWAARAADFIVADTLDVGGASNLGGATTVGTPMMNANLTVNGTVTAVRATVNGALTAGATNVAGLTAGATTVNGALTAGATNVAGLTASSLTLPMANGIPNVTGFRVTPAFDRISFIKGFLGLPETPDFDMGVRSTQGACFLTSVATYDSNSSCEVFIGVNGNWALGLRRANVAAFGLSACAAQCLVLKD